MPADDQLVFLKVMLGTRDASSMVYHVDVEDIDRGADKCTVVMVNPNSTSADAVLTGQTMEVELGWGSEHSLVFEGVIREVHPAAGETQRLQIVAFDLSSRMTRALAPLELRVHTGTLKDVLTRIAARHNISMGAVQVDPMPQLQLRQQNARNDWEFVQDLAEEFRARCFIEVNAASDDTPAQRERGGRSRFYFWSEEYMLAQDPAGRLQFCHGVGPLLQFEYRLIGGGASPSTTGTVTNPATGEAAAVDGPRTPTGPEPSVDAGRTSGTASALGEGAARTYAASVEAALEAPERPEDLRLRRRLPPAASDPAAAEQAVQQDRTRVLGMVGHGVAMGTVRLRAKGCVTIEGMSTWSNGRWYVSRVNHVVDRATIRLRNQDTTRHTFRSRFTATR